MMEFRKSLEGRDEDAGAVLKFFSDKAEHHYPILYKGEVKILDWVMVKQYLKDTLMWDVDHLWQQYGKSLTEKTIIVPRPGRYKKQWQDFYLKDSEDAKQFLSYIKEMFNLDFQQQIGKARIKYDERNQSYYFSLTNEQYLFFQTKMIRNEGDALYGLREIYRQKAPRLEINRNSCLKVVRVDKDCYFDPLFVDGILPPHKRENLRWGQHKQFTVTGAGVIDQFEKKPRYTAEQKSHYSKAQPVSYSTADPPFFPKIFNPGRSTKCVGVMIDEFNDQKQSNILYTDYNSIKDFGSVGRPVDFDDRQLAEQAAERYVNKTLFSHQNFGKFLTEIQREENKENYNEILARIKWTPDSSCRVFINTDNLESRLAAQMYASIIEKKLNRLGIKNYKVPIIYYMPDHPSLHLKYYTHQEQELDKKEANNIYSDKKIRYDNYSRNNYEFLLFLPPEEIKIAFMRDKLIKIENKNKNARSLLSVILESGYSHILDFIAKEPDPLINKKELDEMICHCISQEGDIELLSRVMCMAVLKNNHTMFDLILDIAKEKNLDLNLILNKKIHDSRFNTTGTPLYFAGMYEKFEMVEKLLKIPDVDVNLSYSIPDKGDWNLLFIASTGGKTQLVKQLLTRRDIDVNQKSSDLDITPLYNAAALGHVSIVSQLIKHPNVDVNSMSVRTFRYFGYAPLHAGVAWGGAEVVRALLTSSTINVNQRSAIIFPNGGITPLKLAASKGMIESAIHLLCHPKIQNSDVNVIDLKKWKEFFEKHPEKIQNFLKRWLRNYNQQRGTLEQQEQTHSWSAMFGGVPKDEKMAAAKFLFDNIIKKKIVYVSEIIDHPEFSKHQRALEGGRLGHFFSLFKEILPLILQQANDIKLIDQVHNATTKKL